VYGTENVKVVSQMRRSLIGGTLTHFQRSGFCQIPVQRSVAGHVVSRSRHTFIESAQGEPIRRADVPSPRRARRTETTQQVQGSYGRHCDGRALNDLRAQSVRRQTLHGCHCTKRNRQQPLLGDSVKGDRFDEEGKPCDTRKCR